MTTDALRPYASLSFASADSPLELRYDGIDARPVNLEKQSA